MVPTSWAAALLFLALVAPGLVFDLLAETRRAGPTESTFREVSRVLLASTLFGGVTLAALAAIRAIFRPPWLVDPGALFRDAPRYLGSDYQQIGWTLAAGLTLSLSLALATHAFLAIRNRGRRIRKHSAWSQVFRQDAPTTPHRIYVRVRTDDDVSYLGTLAGFTPELSTEDRELILGQPGLGVKKSGGSQQALPETFGRIVIPGSAIKAIFVAYPPLEEASDEN